MDIDVLASEAQALRFELAVPIVSIASVQNARVESSVRFGSSGSPSPVFEAASLTKPVFAAAVLQLGASGAIDLDRPLCEYPGGQPPVADERAQRITARLVLSHRSGLPNWVASDADQLIADPGTGFSYSGEAHNYLQRVVEALVGERLDACVERLVLEPARMSMSTMSWSPSLEAVFAGPHDALGQPVARRDQPLMAAGS